MATQHPPDDTAHAAGSDGRPVPLDPQLTRLWRERDALRTRSAALLARCREVLSSVEAVPVEGPIEEDVRQVITALNAVLAERQDVVSLLERFATDHAGAEDAPLSSEEWARLVTAQERLVDLDRAQRRLLAQLEDMHPPAGPAAGE